MIFKELGLTAEFNGAALDRRPLTLAEREAGHNKVVPSIEKAVERCGLKNGMTISFHHHFRGGDYIMNLVIDVLSKMGFKDLVVAPSSLTDIHAPLIDHVKSGVIARFETSGLRGKLADAISSGLMEVPVVFRSHGGRAHAIESRSLPIDVAFLGAPSSDAFGNANGYNPCDPAGIMCGSLGYAKCDAEFARHTVILTGNIVPYPNVPFAIPESAVDAVVPVAEIGDPKGIMQGATRFTSNPKELLIAQNTADIIDAAGYLVQDFSFQTGTGGASLAVTRFLREKMTAKNITARFALGGITGSIVKLHEEGLVQKILDVQGFDLDAAASLRDNHLHTQVSAQFYASPKGEGAAVNQLDVVVLSALECDVDFNVNVLTGSDGVIRGAIGGHQDTAFGAACSIVVCPLTRGRIPCVVDRVGAIVTPGSTVDIIVTEYGAAVNPARPELAAKLSAAGIKTLTMRELRDKAYAIVGTPAPIRYAEKVVGVVTYRDGSVIDTIRQVI